MPGHFKKNDYRAEKTLSAIQEAFCKLLERRSFGRITVNELCEEARISRRTFYLHFNDKYDLLEFCLTEISMKIKISLDGKKNYDQIARSITSLVQKNEKAVSNLMKDANDETLGLLHVFMLSLLDVPEEKDEDGKLSPRYIVFSNFSIGGMMKLLTWQVENKFSQDSQSINMHVISLITHILDWEEGQD